ncbi:polyprenyl synthetase family protein [bacterium]|nr:polyprenyl synthetase family protein [bacterium]MBU3955876.1 polyprenyl synthetase family protein [bacterium]MBU4134509.1 polyprenyl synthetase family protein [bacterium]
MKSEKKLSAFDKFARKNIPALEKNLLRLLPASGSLLNKSRKPTILDRSLVYCMKTGGKRIRPVLFMAVATAINKKNTKSELGKLRDFACGIEFLHSYSLVHDDIMDGDDMRRGLATVCKKFGSATAILAGDALLTRGLEILYGCHFGAAAIINAGVGSPGMIAGQAADMECGGAKKRSEKALWYIHMNKTAAFFSSICAAGAAASGASEKELVKLASFGSNLGLAFQVRDDMLDRTGDRKKYKKSRNDEKNDKLTVLSFHTLADSQKIIDGITSRAESFIKKLPYDTSVLSSLLEKLRVREF